VCEAGTLAGRILGCRPNRTPHADDMDFINLHRRFGATDKRHHEGIMADAKFWLKS